MPVTVEGRTAGGSTRLGDVRRDPHRAGGEHDVAELDATGLLDAEVLLPPLHGRGRGLVQSSLGPSAASVP